MKKAIFDASFFLSFLLPDEESKSQIIDEFIKGKLALIEPFIFSLEVINALKYACVSKRIKKDRLLKIIKSFEDLKNIDYVYNFKFSKLAKLSFQHNVSIYDACYLYLKRETGLPLYSLDKELIH